MLCSHPCSRLETPLPARFRTIHARKRGPRRGLPDLAQHAFAVGRRRRSARPGPGVPESPSGTPRAGGEAPPSGDAPHPQIARTEAVGDLRGPRAPGRRPHRVRAGPPSAAQRFGTAHPPALLCFVPKRQRCSLLAATRPCTLRNRSCRRRQAGRHLVGPWPAHGGPFSVGEYVLEKPGLSARKPGSVPIPGFRVGSRTHGQTPRKPGSRRGIPLATAAGTPSSVARRRRLASCSPPVRRPPAGGASNTDRRGHALTFRHRPPVYRRPWRRRLRPSANRFADPRSRCRPAGRAFGRRPRRKSGGSTGDDSHEPRCRRRGAPTGCSS